MTDPAPLYHWGHDPRALREMLAQAPYTHLIRAPDDPARRARGQDHALGRAPHLELNKLDDEQLREAIWTCLEDHPGQGLTFNAICVELFDVTADVAGLSKLDEALWGLVCQGCVAMTHIAPIRFIRTLELEGMASSAPRYQTRQLTLF